MNATLRRVGAATAAALALLLTTPATAATSTAPGASADAYGLDVDVSLTSLDIKVDQGPFARSSQDYPPQAAAPFDEAELIGVGPTPAGGAVVNNIGVLETFAQATSDPIARAAAAAFDVELLNQGGGPMITAEVIQAASTTDCTNNPSSLGTEIVNLQVAGQDPIPNITPAPNTPLLDAVFNPLGIRVIMNEQHPTADGRGLVVNGLHIYSLSGGVVPGLFTGDVIVSHAMSTVNCPNGAPTTGSGNDIFITKNADKAKAKPGDTVTYTATIKNQTTGATAKDCLVHQVTDHLPIAFEYASTSGALGTVATTVARPGGGTDVVIKPATDVTIPAGGSITQTYVVTVKADAAPGTYFNNVELLCGNLGNWVKGLDAPVQVGDEDDPVTPPVDKPQCDDGKDNDGDGKVDFPADPGCTSKLDDSEINEHPRTGGPSHLTLLGSLLVATAWGIRRRLAAC